MKKLIVLLFFLLLLSCKTTPDKTISEDNLSVLPEDSQNPWSDSEIVSEAEGYTEQSRPGNQGESAQRKDTLILIDPGHGGRDGGAVAQGVTEKELNGKVAWLLGEYLTQWGYQVKFTRPPLNQGISMDLDQRVSILADTQPDILISIHHNASFNTRPKGFSLYWSSYRPWWDQQDIYVIRGEEHFPWEGERIKNNITYVYYNDGVDIREITGDNAYRIEDRSPILIAQESYKLALSLYQNLLLLDHVNPQFMYDQDIPIVDMENRLLRLNQCIAVLVECGFMTNSQELGLLQDAANQEQMALAIATGLKNYLESP